jgi:HlyD family secretion protein
MSKKKKVVFIGIGGCLVILVIILNLTRSTQPAVKVQAEEVKRKDISSKVTASGRIQPETMVKISANIPARIISLPAKEGQGVEKGQLLVLLDKTRYVANVERARSSLNSAISNLKKVEGDYKRAKKLYGKGLTSESEMELLKAQYAAAKSGVEQGRASLKEAEDDLSKCTITSPISGLITRLNKEEGEMVLGAQFQEDVIMVVADLTRIEAQVDVDETDVVDVKPGQEAEIEVDALPDTVLHGQVKEISNTATTTGYGTQEEVTNFKVKITLLHPHPSLRPGMSATVDIITAHHPDSLSVPIQAVVMRPPLKEEKDDSLSSKKANPVEVVFVVEDGVAHQRQIKTGISSETDMEILEGLKEGDKVVTGGYRELRNLKDGDKVKIVKKPLLEEKRK